MPWKDLRPMDERVLFVADYVRELYSFSELCSRYGVSRKTGYKLNFAVGLSPHQARRAARLDVGPSTSTVRVPQ